MRLGVLHIPERRILAAVEEIRRMRGVRCDDGFPRDLGCETQLYLAVALKAEYPDETMASVAEACGAEIPDAIFFAELCEIAREAGWMRQEIIEKAGDALCGRPLLDWTKMRRAVAA